jgi:hypothetical protein
MSKANGGTAVKQDAAADRNGKVIDEHEPPPVDGATHESARQVLRTAAAIWLPARCRHRAIALPLAADHLLRGSGGSRSRWSDRLACRRRGRCRRVDRAASHARLERASPWNSLRRFQGDSLPDGWINSAYALVRRARPGRR